MANIIPFPVPAPASADGRKLVQSTAPAIAGGNQPAEPKTKYADEPYLSEAEKGELLNTPPAELSKADQEARIQVLISWRTELLTPKQRKEQEKVINDRLNRSFPKPQTPPIKKQAPAAAHFAVA